MPHAAATVRPLKPGLLSDPRTAAARCDTFVVTLIYRPDPAVGPRQIDSRAINLRRFSRRDALTMLVYAFSTDTCGR